VTAASAPATPIHLFQATTHWSARYASIRSEVTSSVIHPHYGISLYHTRFCCNIDLTAIEYLHSFNSAYSYSARHEMNGSVKISRLKRALPGSSKPVEGIHSAIIQQKPNTIKAIIRILLRNPQDDYYYASYTDRGILAVQKSSFFKVVSVQQFNCDDIIQQARILSRIQHPNVASAYDLYCYNEQNFLVMDYLSLRISHLETQEHELEEWEIATIVSEVRPTCRWW
jgi:hypothetical protein